MHAEPMSAPATADEGGRGRGHGRICARLLSLATIGLVEGSYLFSPCHALGRSVPAHGHPKRDLCLSNHAAHFENSKADRVVPNHAVSVLDSGPLRTCHRMADTVRAAHRSR